MWCSLVGVPRSPTHQRGCKHTSAALQNRAPAARQAQRGSSDEEMETFMFGGRTKGDMNRGAAVPGARTRRSWLAPCGSARKSSWWAVLRAWWYKKGAAGFPRLSQQEIYGRGLTSSVTTPFEHLFAKSAFLVCQNLKNRPCFLFDYLRGGVCFRPFKTPSG